MKKCFYSLWCIVTVFVLSSCGHSKLVTESVRYFSIRTQYKQPDEQHPIPDNANISVAYCIDESGDISVIVYNRSSEIMTLDLTKSFFINSNGASVSYYDPTIKTSTTSNTTSSTSGASLNLGAVANVLGMGRSVIGTLARGVNVGGANTNSTTVTNVTQIIEQPRVSIGPHGYGLLPHTYNEPRIHEFNIHNPWGDKIIAEQKYDLFSKMSKDESNCKFSICISYSVDGEKTFESFVTDFYVNSYILSPVTTHGSVNEAMQRIFLIKPDALNEPYWRLKIISNLPKPSSAHGECILYDYN